MAECIPNRRGLYIKPPPRFTFEEWSLATKRTNDAAESDRQYAEHIQAEAHRTFDESLEVALKARQDIAHRFKERKHDVDYWKGELLQKFGQLNNEIDALVIYRARLQAASGSFQHLLDTDKQILAYRNCRVGIDLVTDQPEREIHAEMKIAEGIQPVLHRSLEYLAEQLRLLRKTAYQLDRELQDKNKAIQIDDLAETLNVHRSEVHPHCQLVISDISNVDERDWEEMTQKNKLAAEKNINASIQMRTTVDSLLRQACEDLSKQVCITSMAMERRLKEVVDAKALLETQHAELSKTYREMEGVICKLDHAFEEKKGLVALAETRLRLRQQRPGMELVKDAVQRTLILEIHNHNQQMAKLNARILQAQNARRNLGRQQLEVEDAINVKTNTIAIDETKCIPLRKSIRIQEY